MPCYKPLKGWYASKRNESGKRSIVFDFKEGMYDRPITVPCGQCIGCRLERSRQWAVRCCHEASLYSENCFITLTFSDSVLASSVYNNGGNLGFSRTLHKPDFQKFMKRLRKRFGEGIRYFHCGEYGEKLGRPHHHACIFNFDFPDKVLWSIRDGVRLYRSEILEKLWSNPKTGECYGFCTIGDVTFESAAYVARYIVKKITGDKSDEHYQGRVKEYVTMSRRPGIGKDWIKKFSSDVYPSDKVVVRGDVICKPPKYYDSVYELDNLDKMSILKSKRRVSAKDNPDNRDDRLAIRGKVKLQTIKQLRRSYEASDVQCI